MELIRRSIAIAAAMLSFFVLTQSISRAGDGATSTANDLRHPAAYMASCPYYDPAGSIKIGQAMLTTSTTIGLVYNEQIVALKPTPRIPEAYILSGKNGAQYLFASKDDGILNLHANSFATLTSSKKSDAQVLPRLARYLRAPYTPADLVLTPSFSRTWDGSYAKKKY